MRCSLILSLICLWPIHVYAAENRRVVDDAFITLEPGTNLRRFGDRTVGKMLVRIKGEGKHFGEEQRKRYCRLKQARKIQWILNDLETGKIISRSSNAEERYFGASVAKLFVAAALLNKQKGYFNSAQLTLMVRLIVHPRSMIGNNNDINCLCKGVCWQELGTQKIMSLLAWKRSA